MNSVELTVSFAETEPMHTLSIVTGHVGLAVTVDVSPLGLSSGLAAPPGDLGDCTFVE